MSYRTTLHLACQYFIHFSSQSLFKSRIRIRVSWSIKHTWIRDRIQPVFSLNTDEYGKNMGIEYGSRITRMRIRDSRIRLRRIRIPVFKAVQILVIRDPYSIPVFLPYSSVFKLNTGWIRSRIQVCFAQCDHSISETKMI